MTSRTPQRRRPRTGAAPTAAPRDAAPPVNPRRRRRKRHPYAHLVKPCLIFLAILTLLILLSVDFNSFELQVELPKEIHAEYGVEFTAPDPNAVLKGGLFGISREAEYEVEGEVDVYSMGEQEITYRVSCRTFWLLFPRNFEKRIQCNVEVSDTMAPVITLTTSDAPTTYQGASYVEEGFTASDYFDGDVTANVTSYEQDGQVFYSVTDSHGNTGTAVRQIQYREGVESNGKTIYLTFDDGPGKYTEELLDILKKYNVKVTFFVVNTDYTHIIQRIAQEGHSIAVHSYTHDYNQIYKSESAYFQDVELMQEVIVQYAGKRTNMLRFPGGSSNTQSKYNAGIMTRLSKEVGRKGYYYFDWNVDSKDAGGAKTAEQVFENVKNGVQTREVSIVLQHDIKEYSVDAVEMILQWGLENGYTFRALDESSPGCHHKIAN